MLVRRHHPEPLDRPSSDLSRFRSTKCNNTQRLPSFPRSVWILIYVGAPLDWILPFCQTLHGFKLFVLLCSFLSFPTLAGLMNVVCQSRRSGSRLRCWGPCKFEWLPNAPYSTTCILRSFGQVLVSVQYNFKYCQTSADIVSFFIAAKVNLVRTMHRDDCRAFEAHILKGNWILPCELCINRVYKIWCPRR